MRKSIEPDDRTAQQMRSAEIDEKRLSRVEKSLRGLQALGTTLLGAGLLATAAPYIDQPDASNGTKCEIATQIVENFRERAPTTPDDKAMDRKARAFVNRECLE